MDTKDKSTTDPLHECRERFKKAIEYWDDDRSNGLDDIKFRAGEQWPEEIKNQRLKDKRPCLTVDKLNQYIRQIVNDGRQNRPSIKVSPVDGKSDIATAEVMAGIVKHIESRSNADAAYDTALDSVATCGFGYFTVSTEYTGTETFDQEIKINRVRNPLSIVIDPSSTEADASDMKFAFVVEEMDKDAFEEKYPGKTPADWDSEKYSGWYGETVRLARYWEVREEDRTLYLMADNTVISLARYTELKEAGIEIDSLVKGKRNIPIRKVFHSLVSGAEYLEEPKEWIGTYIPICVVYGNETDIEGKVTHSGIIRPAKDPQRLYNYSRSAFAERVALAPKAPWLAAEGQVEDREDEWRKANTTSNSVLIYKPTSLNGQPVPPPSRINPSDVPVGFQQDMQISEHDIQGAIGMYAASLGAPSNERSGKAIMARQREGDTGTFHYHDNLNRAIRHCGRIIVDMIPKVYDSNRVVRIMGYDGKVSDANIDPTIPTASQKNGVSMLYNLGVGTYDVTITSGPSYNTLRQEAAESMVTMVQAHPELMNVIGDLMVKNMDWPGAEEISKRLHMVLPQPILQAEQKAAADKMPPEMQQIVEQFDAAMQQKEAAIHAAADEIERLRAESEELKMENKRIQLQAQESEVKAAQQLFKKDVDLAKQVLKNEESAAMDRVRQNAEVQPPVQQDSEQQLGVAELLQAVSSMQQPISITVPVTIEGKSATVKQGRAVKQPDGSYIMESIETPTELPGQAEQPIG